MSQSSADALSQARARFASADDRRRSAVAELTALVAPTEGPPPAGAALARIRELEAALPALERERAEAHAALGRAMLDEFADHLGKLTYPLHDPEATRELRLMADNLARACLAIISDWPELQQEANQRLRPPAPPTPPAPPAPPTPPGTPHG